MMLRIRNVNFENKKIKLNNSDLMKNKTEYSKCRIPYKNRRTFHMKKVIKEKKKYLLLV